MADHIFAVVFVAVAGITVVDIVFLFHMETCIFQNIQWFAQAFLHLSIFKIIEMHSSDTTFMTFCHANNILLTIKKNSFCRCLWYLHFQTTDSLEMSFYIFIWISWAKCCPCDLGQYNIFCKEYFDIFADVYGYVPLATVKMSNLVQNFAKIKRANS